MIIWTWTRFNVPESAKHPYSVMLPPPCLTVGTVFSSPFFHQTKATSKQLQFSPIRPKDRPPKLISTFQIAKSKWVLLTLWVISWVIPWSPLRWRTFIAAYPETSRPDVASSATVIFAEIQGLLTSEDFSSVRSLTLYTCIPSHVFRTEHISLSFVMMRHTAVLDLENTWK